jgi:hypothetical protein
MRLSELVVALLVATACEAMTLEELSDMIMNNPEQVISLYLINRLRYKIACPM